MTTCTAYNYACALSPVAVDMTSTLSGKTVTKVAAGGVSSLALASDGKVYSWGSNNHSPVAVDMSGVLSGKAITQIAAGGNHSLVSTSEGKAYSWGRNTYGQIGNGGGNNETSPVAVDGTLLNSVMPFTITLDGQYCTDIDTGGNIITSSISFASNGTWVKCNTPAHTPGLVPVAISNGLDNLTMPAACTDGQSYGGSGGNGGTACNGRLDNGEARHGDRSNITTGFLYEEIYISLSTNSSLVQIGGGGGLTPTVAGTFGSGLNTATTMTNNPFGYSMSISNSQSSVNPTNVHAKDMKHTTLNEYLTATTNTCSWTSGTPGSLAHDTTNALTNNTWGFTLNSANLTTQRLCQVPDLSSPLTIKQTTTANETGDATNIYYGTKIDFSASVGEYHAAVVYTVVPEV
jgi:hypothetical protein